MRTHPFRPVIAALLLLCFSRPAPGLTVVLPPDQNHTSLHKAAETGDPGKVREVMAAMSEPDRARTLNLLDRDGYTPLAYAAQAGNSETAELLLKNGAGVDVAENPNGWTPLLRAAQQSHAEAVRLLLEHGADPNVRAWLGKTPLSEALRGTVIHYGPEGDREATVKLLLEHGAAIGPLLEEHDGLISAFHRQREQIETFQAEKQQQDAERLNLQRQIKQLESQCRELQALLDKIRSATGDPGYRPN